MSRLLYLFGIIHALKMYNLMTSSIECKSLVAHANEVISKTLNYGGSFSSLNRCTILSNKNCLFCLDDDSTVRLGEDISFQ